MIQSVFGLGPERVRAVNPKMVYASASGFGQNGPEQRARRRQLDHRGFFRRAVGARLSTAAPAGAP